MQHLRLTLGLVLMMPILLAMTTTDASAHYCHVSAQPTAEDTTACDAHGCGGAEAEGTEGYEEIQHWHWHTVWHTDDGRYKHHCHSYGCAATGDVVCRALDVITAIDGTLP